MAKNFDQSREAAKNRSRNAYDAPISGFSVNFNTFPIAFAPGPKLGVPGLVSLDPYPIPGIRLRNNTSTTTGGRSSVQASRVTQQNSTEIIASG